jgi:hypothetical protein
MLDCSGRKYGMENGSEKNDNVSNSLSGFFVSGAILIFAAHANIEWLALIGLLGAFIFSWRAASNSHVEGDHRPRMRGESVFQSAGRQGKGSRGGCFGFVGLWVSLLGVALLFDGTDWICSLTFIAGGLYWFTGD